MTDTTRTTELAPTILFGAFDRHNFGDLLFPHIAAAMLGHDNIVYAGLGERDLRSCGGHQVRGILQLASEYGKRPVNIIHVGGEILTCNAWQAAAMLLPPSQAKAMIAQYDMRPREAHAWAVSQLGFSALAPYSLPRRLFPGARQVVYSAVGGVGLEECDADVRAEVFDNLRAADAVGVRDWKTHALLQAAGIASQLMPDSAVMVAELFGDLVRGRMQQEAVAPVLQAFPRGYVAVQFSADFADEGTIPQIARQLDRIAQDHGLGIVFFRAGAAPWHDDMHSYQHVAACMRSSATRIFSSLNIWDICALIAASRAYAGSSLHGRIVAMAFAVPRINLLHPDLLGRLGKQAAFASTWDSVSHPATVRLDDIAAGVTQAMAVERGILQEEAQRLVAAYRSGFQQLDARLP